MTANDLISTTWNRPSQLERDQVRLQVGMPAADLQAEQRVVEQRPGARVRRGCPGEQAPGPGVPQFQAGVAADLAEVVVVRLRDRQAQVLAQQPEQLGGAVGLHLGLERVTPGEGEPGLAERGGEARVGGEPLLVDAGRVQDRAPGAARVAGQRGDGPRVVAAWAGPGRGCGPGAASVPFNCLSFGLRRAGGCRKTAPRRRAGCAPVPRRPAVPRCRRPRGPPAPPAAASAT